MATLQLREVKVTPNLEKFMTDVVPEDLTRTLQYVFLSELENQARLFGAKPTTVLVDGGRGQLTGVKRRAQAFFSNRARVIAALTEAWDLLVRMTRVKSGAARRSYALYVNGQRFGERGDIARLVQATSPSDFVSIVGPGVPYGRKLYWRPLGTGKKIRKKAATIKSKGVETTYFGTYTEPMHRTVKRILSKKYPDLFITDAWWPLAHGGGKQGERWPAITVGFKSSKKSGLGVN